jgi:hypothetical protein
MPEVVKKRSKKFLKERILRYGPVVFIRKNIFLFSFLTIFLLTLILGLWDISKYEVYDLDGNEVESLLYSQMQEYIKENIYGENYFLFSPSTVRQDMYLSISRLKSVRIEKSIPNKLIFFVEIYEPKYTTFLKTKKCNILSSEGIVLEQICKDDQGDSTQECCKEYVKNNSLVFFSSPDVEISVLDNDKDRLLILEEIKKVVTVVEAFKYEIEDITLENDILEVKDNEGRIFRFTIADDINVQLKRFMVVIGRIKSDYMEVGTLDLRFERPVMKE